MKRLLSVMLTVVLAMACLAGSLVLFAGCNNPDDIQIDPNRTQLYIGVKDDGIGKEWVYDAIKKYETANPEIQVIPKFEDALFEEKNIKTTMPSAKEAVYVLSGISYFNWLKSDNTSDILVNLYDTITVDPDGDGPQKSIYDRMDPQDREHLTVDLANGGKAIYTLPYYDTYWGAIYDKDLFTEKGFYSLDEYTGLNGEDGDEDDELGPDGEEGTYDDGLPATWEDMKILLDTMADSGVIPFTWTHNYYTYQTGFLRYVMASYEGKHDYELRYNMNGTDSDVGAVDYKTAWKLADQEGIRAAVTVAHHIASNPKYYSQKAYFASQDHIAAQDEFILSVKASDSKPIGFLIESGWWENEAKGTFASMEAAFGEDYGYGKRNFAWLPFPKFIGTEGIKDQTNTRTTMYGGVGTGGGGWMLSKNVSEEIKPIALDFIQFCNTESMMARFTEVTGICRPYDYTMSDAQKAAMTSYTRTIWDNRESENVDTIRYKTKNPLIVNASSYFADYEFHALLRADTNNETTSKNPLDAFHNDATLTVQDYIDGIKARYNKENWESNLSKWYYLLEE